MTTAGDKVKNAIDRTVKKAKGLATDAKEMVSKGTGKAKEAARSVGSAVENVGHAIKDAARDKAPQQTETNVHSSGMPYA